MKPAGPLRTAVWATWPALPIRAVATLGRPAAEFGGATDLAPAERSVLFGPPVLAAGGLDGPGDLAVAGATSWRSSLGNRRGRRLRGSRVRMGGRRGAPVRVGHRCCADHVSRLGQLGPTSGG